MTTDAGQVIQIDGLWGLAFTTTAEDPTHPTLIFTAGPEDEEHGLLGSEVGPNDVVITLGAGDVNRLAQSLAEEGSQA